MNAVTHISDHVQSISRRPTSLIRAAKAGQTGWRRERHLTKLLRLEHCPEPVAALARLLAEESKQNEARKWRTPFYDMQRHVLLMIAILAELQLISGRETKTPKHP